MFRIGCNLRNPEELKDQVREKTVQVEEIALEKEIAFLECWGNSWEVSRDDIEGTEEGRGKICNQRGHGPYRMDIDMVPFILVPLEGLKMRKFLIIVLKRTVLATVGKREFGRTAGKAEIQLGSKCHGPGERC